ncbi:hypothetical protein EDD85DRAFT_543086 [Armillaria nabsnona]|nr:hypothetical protein EDD85DRAFT_543086 [Armillaria nabsnona]
MSSTFILPFITRILASSDCSPPVPPRFLLKYSFPPSFLLFYSSTDIRSPVSFRYNEPFFSASLSSSRNGFQNDVVWKPCLLPPPTDPPFLCILNPDSLLIVLILRSSRSKRIALCEPALSSKSDDYSLYITLLSVHANATSEWDKLPTIKNSFSSFSIRLGFLLI